MILLCFPCSVQFSHSVVSNSLQLHESQHARPPCPSSTLGVYSNSCPSSQWCHPAISSSVVHFSSLPLIPPSIRLFSNESTLHIRWPKYWSFSFSISFQRNPRADLLQNGLLGSPYSYVLDVHICLRCTICWFHTCIYYNMIITIA